MRKSWPGHGLQKAWLTVHIVSMLILSLSVQATEPESAGENPTLYSSFASGQKFYLENDSFQAGENGKLQYSVTSDTGGGGRRVSQNEIDCTTGEFKSPIESWQEDNKGRISDQKPGPAVKMSLNQKTHLYRTLKDACQKHMPQVQANW